MPPGSYFPFLEMELSTLSLLFPSQQGEQDLPEVSRRDLDLLIAEEDEALLLEERRRAHLAPDGQAPGIDNLGLCSAPPLLFCTLSPDPLSAETKEEPRAPEGNTIVPPLSPLALAQ